jgi:hypothetical protein
MPSTLRLTLILAVSLTLPACGGGNDKKNDQRTAEGEILPGSISDAMIPYDTVRSQPPFEPKADATSTAKGAPQSKTDSAGGEAAAAPAETEDETPVEAPPTTRDE